MPQTTFEEKKVEQKLKNDIEREHLFAVSSLYDTKDPGRCIVWPKSVLRLVAQCPQQHVLFVCLLRTKDMLNLELQIGLAVHIGHTSLCSRHDRTKPTFENHIATPLYKETSAA